jgi:GNAT superfamily N-acetyltransferase
MRIDIRPFEVTDRDAVIRLALSIQREEFGIDITAAEQPDLLDVVGHYQRGAGGFWVAMDGAVVVGTVGLLDIGQGDGALRKMFVAPAHRGSGVADALLRTCLHWAKARSLRRVLLGTTEQFRAAHRFYEKSGFMLLAAGELPSRFPRMRLDTRFYARTLTE